MDLRSNFKVTDTICKPHKYKPRPVVIPMVTPRPKPKSSDYAPRCRTRSGRAPRLQHLHFLRFMAAQPEAWFSTDDFYANWRISQKYLVRVLGQLKAAMLIDRIKHPTKKGNSSLYRITKKGADCAEVGLIAVQHAIHKGVNKHV